MSRKCLEDIVQCEQAIYDALGAPCGERYNKTDAKLNLKQLLIFTELNFDQITSQNIQMKNLLPVYHRVVEAEAKAKSSVDISAFFHKLLCENTRKDYEILTVLQIIYQILKTLRPEDSHYLVIKAEVLQIFIDLLLANQGPTLNASISTCLQLYVRKFGGKNLIDKLWKTISCKSCERNVSHHHAVIIVQLFDEFMLCMKDFHKNVQLISIIQNLLISEEQEKRKLAYFIMKKILKVIIDRAGNVSEWELDNTAALSSFWTTYITVMENIEIQQSNLILSCLETFKTMRNESLNVSWRKWMDIMYIRILACNDLKCKCWVAEHLITTYACGEITPEVLAQLMAALNVLDLYNIDEYTLCQVNAEVFFKIDCIPFIELLPRYNWLSVPLHFWLSKLKIYFNSDERISNDLLLRIALRVRSLQNVQIRKLAIEALEETFATIIATMELDEYVTFIETLYNPCDGFRNFPLFVNKLGTIKTCRKHVQFTQLFYDILTHDYFILPEEILIDMMHCFKDLPKDWHGWLRFLFVFNSDCTESIVRFCHEKYDIDLDTLILSSPAEYAQFGKKLIWQKEEETFVRRKSVDFFVTHLERYSNLHGVNITLQKVLSMGSYDTLFKISKLLSNSKERLEEMYIELLVEMLRRYAKETSIGYCVLNLINHCKKTQTPIIATQFGEEILKIDLANNDICSGVLYSGITLSKECFFIGLLLGEEKSKELSIENYYRYKSIYSTPDIVFVRSNYLTRMPHEYRKEMIFALLTKDNELGLQNSEYKINSLEHRLKIRIARAILYIVLNREVLPFWTKDFWRILFHDKNALNIICIYEFIVACCAPNFHVILDKLKESAKFTPEQQISMISVAHLYFMFNCNNKNEVKNIQIITNSLLPLSMSQNDQIRLHAQLAIYNILNLEKVNTPHFIEVLDAVKTALGSKLRNLLQDIRFKLPSLRSTCSENGWKFENCFMYILNIPFDEYDSENDRTFYDFMIARQKFAEKLNTDPAHNEILKKDPILCGDGAILKSESFLTQHLKSYPECLDNEIYVVASLINNPSNLSVIARTCKILGIKNLIVHSIEHIEKYEFQKYSVSCDGKLRIFEVKQNSLPEFLLQKQIEGFQIIGTEQSLRSDTVVEDLSSLKKCILILSYERLGMPPNLIGFLDYTLKIPFFGMMGFHNLHLATALLMWETEKQYMLQN